MKRRTMLLKKSKDAKSVDISILAGKNHLNDLKVEVINS